MTLTDKAAELEALLFASGDPVDPLKIADLLQIDKGAVPQLADKLNECYTDNSSSLAVIVLGGRYQLAVKKEYAAVVQAAVREKKNAPLSAPAMEALTIIAYNQPVTKSFVEHIRGVDSSGVVNSLVAKGLVEEAGRLDLPGKPIAYRTTDTFLRCFDIKSLDELPPLPTRADAASFAQGEGTDEDMAAPDGKGGDDM